MKIEIAIEGPRETVLALQQRLPKGSKQPDRGVRDDPERARLILVEEDGRVNEALIRISAIAERELPNAEALEFRVRNLAYSEPSPWCESHREPFQPVPSLTVQPWSPSALPADERHTILLDSNLAFGNGTLPEGDPRLVPWSVGIEREKRPRLRLRHSAPGYRRHEMGGKPLPGGRDRSRGCSYG
jgi:hypothetical protein